MSDQNFVKSLNDIPAVASYLARIGAEPRGLKTAVVKITSGQYWRDVGKIVFEDGKVTTERPEDAPTESEQVLIADQWGEYKFPKVQKLKVLDPANLPPGIQDMNDSNLFIFRDMGGNVLMLQYREDKKDGGKAYLPWTYWEDGVWRMAEPDGLLPLWGLEQLKDYKIVFIHEGARAARTCAEMVARKKAGEDVTHPWLNQLSHAAHLGWISGALSPSRTDWSMLRKHGVTKAIIVADNDWEGKGAIPAISQRLDFPTFMIEFTDEFPASFDLHDPFPDHMWADGSYIGPYFRECLHPATWATKKIPNPSGKGAPLIVLRECFKNMWVYVEEANLFVCRSMPEFVRDSEILKRMLAPFAHGKNIIDLILKEQRGRSVKLAYRPDIDSTSKIKVTYDGVNAINTHVPTRIHSQKGDISMFEDFLEYLVVNENERDQVKKWAATLIARPGVRMGFGLLMVSERQGVGKTTLGAHILAPLVGWHNVSVPSEDDLLSPFTEWASHKRLIVVNEIYTGASWRAYNKLKSIMTDKRVNVNRKFMREYTIENWCHFYACSNSRRAIKIEDSDRRWFYPELTEELWPSEKFAELHKWLQSGGLSKIKHWAENYGDYLEFGDHAPMTNRKKELIEVSMSEAKREGVRIAHMLADVTDRPVALVMRDIRKSIREEIEDRRIYDSDHQLRKEMRKVDGIYVWSKRLKIEGVMQYVLLNSMAYREVSHAENPNKLIRHLRVGVDSIMEETF